MLASLLKNNNILKNKAFIGGKWLSADNNTFDVINPFDKKPIIKIPDMGFDETNLAIKQANLAFQTWQYTDIKTKFNILSNWYQAMMDNQKDLATIIVFEQGKPMAEAMGEINYAANFIQWFAEQAKRIHGTIVTNFSQDQQLQYTKEPVGVVAINNTLEFSPSYDY